MNKFEDKVYNIVSEIPRGRVTTYKNIAKKAGMPGSARAVGRILNKNHNSQIPCHRVILSSGKAGGFNRGESKKILLLQKEGIKIKGGEVSLNQYLWDIG